MRSRWIAVGLGLLGAGLVLLAASRNWYVISAQGLPGALGSTRTGNDVAPALPALGLAAAACAAVLGTSGRVLRPVTAALLVLAGAGVVVAVLTNDGVATMSEVHQSHVWPTLVLVGAGLVVIAGLVGLASFRSWPAPTRRYERAGAGPYAPDATSGADGTRAEGTRADGTRADGTRADLDDWTSLSQGHDPT